MSIMTTIFSKPERQIKLYNSLHRHPSDPLKAQILLKPEHLEIVFLEPDPGDTLAGTIGFVVSGQVLTTVIFTWCSPEEPAEQIWRQTIDAAQKWSATHVPVGAGLVLDPHIVCLNDNVGTPDEVEVASWKERMPPNNGILIPVCRHDY